MRDHVWIMQNAYEMSRDIFYHKEVPIAAIVTDSKGTEISRATNSKEGLLDASGHAEINALKKAAQSLKTWRLNDCHLYVTLEPCPMCLSAISQFRVSKLFFSAYDSKGGAISLGYHLHKDPRLNHKFQVMGGILQYQSSKLLSNYFREKRGQHSLLE